MIGIIYGYFQPKTNKWYIGQTTNEKRRKRSFYNDKFYSSSKNNISKIDIARHKYTPYSFQYEILFQIDLNDIDKLTRLLNEKETHFIKKYDSFNNGYNSNEGGGENARGFIANEEYRKKCSKRMKGKSNPFYGKHHTEETRLLLSNIRKGINNIEENKQRKSYSRLRGIKRCDETKERCCLSQPNRKEIVAYKDDGTYYEFKSISQGARFVGGNHTNIIKCLQGSYFDTRTKSMKNALSYKGFKWKYKENDIRKFIKTGKGSDGYKRMIEQCHKNGLKSAIKVKVFDLENNPLDICDSLKQCSLKYNVNITQIKRVCEGGYYDKKHEKFVKYNQAKGYIFKYV